MVNSESYVSVAEASAILNDHIVNATFPDITTLSAQEGLLRTATFQLDNCLRFEGTLLLTNQALKFPRTGLLDSEDRELLGVPKLIKVATAYQAEHLSAGDWREAYDQTVSSVKVGPVEVSLNRKEEQEQRSIPLSPSVVQLLSSISTIALRTSMRRRVRRLYSA